MKRRLPNRPQRHQESGFTLIEVLIAITIAGFVLVSLAAATRMLGVSWTSNTENLLRQDMFLRGLAVVSRDVHGMLRLYLDAGSSDRNDRGFKINTSNEQRRESADRFAFAGTSSRMEFVVVEPPYPTRPGIYFVRYRVVPEKHGFALLRERASYKPNMTNLDKLDYGDGVILLEGRYRFNFSYAGEKAGELIWSDNWNVPKDMPKAVRLAVASVDTGRPVIAPFSMRPRIDAEHDCLSPKSPKCSVAVATDTEDAAADGEQDDGTTAPRSGPSPTGASRGNNRGTPR